MSETTAKREDAKRSRLWIEFVVFFLLAPLLMAVFLPPRWMFPMLFAFTVVGLVLLAITPAFRWRELAHGLGRMSVWLILWVSLGTALVGFCIVMWTRPEALGFLLRNNPQLMLMIALAYPLVSALPQELVFRPLFFRRYGAILPRSTMLSVVLNAAIFAFAHLMYWSWVVAGMTFLGGLVFATSYRVRNNFPEAVVLHAVSGVIVFALGLGIYFYSGGVRRPF